MTLIVAFLYKKKRSPFWWLRFKKPDGKYSSISTKCRLKVAPEVRRARQMAAEKTLQEFKQPRAAQLQQRWDHWVTDYLRARYHGSHSLERYLSAWATLSLFLSEQKVATPQELRRAHCFAYLNWREHPDKRTGKYRACRNTALLELKLLRVIMQEAVERDLCVGNPCVKLGVKREKPKRVKPEFSPEHIAMIRDRIARIEPPAAREFFHLSFEIAHHHGCRLSETSLNPQTDVEFFKTAGSVRGTIHFCAKGDKEYTVPLHPNLIPIFQKLKASGRTFTWQTPTGSDRQWASGKWFRFLRRIGLKQMLPGACYHSTRVSVASELERKGVSEKKAMAYMGHASSTVHRIYVRHRAEDLSDCSAAIG